MRFRTQAKRLASTTGFVVITLLLAACGGGGGGSGSSTGAGGSPAPNPPAASSSAATSSSESSSIASSNSSSASSVSNSSSSVSSSGVSLYVTEPVVSTCNIGVLKDSERSDVLAKLNEVRIRHGLLPVSYDASEDAAAAEAAMYMVANKTLTTAPDSNGLCYTTAAAQFAARSNLYAYLTPSGTTQNVPGPLAVVSYLVNVGVDSLGVRRRLLNPFLGETTYGRVDGQPSGTTYQHMSSVLKVQGNDISDVSAMSNDFVAYPYGIYPASEFASGWYLSFSAIASKTTASANGSANVNFSGATISILDGLTPIAITDQASDYSGYGLANSLQWKAVGLQPNVTYAVRIDNAIVNGVPRQYNYTFTLQ